jgi:hypothetical protein
MKNIFVFAFLFSVNSFFGQINNNWCGTDIILNQLKSKYPGFESTIHKSMVKAASGDKVGLPKSTLIVPVVVHVIHDNGIGNISEEQIQNGLDILNQDYNRTNPDAPSTRSTPNAPFQSVAGAMNIQFKLAKIDPDGNCTNGIIRVNAPGLANNANDDCKYTSNGGSDQWDMDRYLNIWVVNSIENNGGTGIILGYAYLPYWPSGTNYGILIRNDAFGTTGTAANSDGRTLTHEMGHLLGLQHIFDPGNSGTTGCHTTNCNQNGDYCCDTPPQTEANWSCSPTWNSCTSVPQNDAFGFDVLDQIENYMSYNYCQNMFSMDQVGIMTQNFIDINFMANWITLANSISTGVNTPEELCKADFEANKILLCGGDSVSFIDRSFHNPSTWQWTISPGLENIDWEFTNGSNANAQNPFIRFFTEGLYTISLLSSDGISSANETKSNFIKVLPASSELPFWEGFESITNLNNSNSWTVVNFEGNNTFQIDPSTGHSSAQCVKLVNFGQTGDNTDELISGPVNLSTLDPASQNMTLSFRYAYVKRNVNDDEWLKVFITKNCGETWVQRKTLHGNSLSSQLESFSWSPSNQQDWVTVHMTNITTDYFVDNFRYKFEFEGHNGNNFYLDDINIYSGSPSDNLVLSNEALTFDGDMEVYPNPSENEFNIQFLATNAQLVKLEIKDVMGKIVYKTLIHAASGKNIVQLTTDKWANGFYTISLDNGSGTNSQSFIKN